MNMSEALKAGKAKTSALIHKPNTPAKLAHMWKEIVSQEAGAMINLPEGKTGGQFKTFLKLCPPGKGEEVLTAVLADWAGFTAQVKTKAGKTTVPSLPSVDFLLKHTGIAVMFATPVQLISKPQEQEAPKATVLPKPSPVQSISNDDETPATYEELVALSKGL